MTITATYDSDAITRISNGPRGFRLFEEGVPEPPVGAMLQCGAPVGLGDHIQFEHIDDGPDGWVERVNGNPRGRRVPWRVVAFWLPMRGTA